MVIFTIQRKKGTFLMKGPLVICCFRYYYIINGLKIWEMTPEP